MTHRAYLGENAYAHVTAQKSRKHGRTTGRKVWKTRAFAILVLDDRNVVAARGSLIPRPVEITRRGRRIRANVLV